MQLNLVWKKCKSLLYILDAPKNILVKTQKSSSVYAVRERMRREPTQSRLFILLSTHPMVLSFSSADEELKSAAFPETTPWRVELCDRRDVE